MQPSQQLIGERMEIWFAAAAGTYSRKDANLLFELAKKGRYPSFLSELAESFGMMMVKVEARDFRLKDTIEELEAAKEQLEKCNTQPS